MRKSRVENIIKNKMVSIGIIIIFLTLFSNNIFSQSNSNYIRIEGSSNVNQFYFEQPIYQQHNLFNVQYSLSEEHIEIEIPVSDFKASNPMMKKDFFNLIKADEFPKIFIQLTFPIISTLSKEATNITSIAKIVFVGKEKEYKINSNILFDTSDSFIMEGVLKLNIDDFNLTPPTKFMGMVKVDKEVFIKFAFNVENNLLTKNE